MSIKSKVLAAAATLTLVGGVGAGGALTAGTAAAATPSCGHHCIDVFSRDFGTHASPNFVMDVLRQGEKVNQPIILFRTSNNDPAEDFTVAFQGFVSDFAAAGLVLPQVALHYGGGCAIHETDGDGAATPGETATCETFYPDDAALEFEYAPFGVDSGLCVGLAATAVWGEGVTLQPCGVSAKTVWIADTFDSPATLANGYIPLINGSDTNFSHPFVLTYPAGANPTDKPRIQLVVQNLTGFTQPGKFFPVISSVKSGQLFFATFGVLP
jgi:hypothetical protein